MYIYFQKEEQNMFALSAETLTGWDFLVAGLIVLFTEFVIKPLFKNTSEKTQNIVMKVAPVLLGGIVYLVLALVSKSATWHAGLIHGAAVGLAAMGSYDLILKTIKEAGMKGLKDTNEALKEAITKKN